MDGGGNDQYVDMFVGVMSQGKNDNGEIYALYISVHGHKNWQHVQCVGLSANIYIFHDFLGEELYLEVVLLKIGNILQNSLKYNLLENN